MDSPYKRNKYRKKNTSKTQSQTHTTNETAKNTKSNKKNVLKGGSVLENNQEDNTKFFYNS